MLQVAHPDDDSFEVQNCFELRFFNRMSNINSMSNTFQYLTRLNFFPNAQFIFGVVVLTTVTHRNRIGKLFWQHLHSHMSTGYIGQ